MRSTWRVFFLRLVLLLEALLPASRAHRRDRCTHLFWDSIFPFSACKWRAPASPGDSTLRHVPSLGILTPSTSCFALHPAGLVSSRPALMGFTRSPPSRTGLSTVSRHRASERSRALHLVRRPFERRSSARFPSPGLSPLSWLPGFLTRTPPLRFTEPHPVSRMTPCWHFGVSRHERIGMLSASCEGRDPCPPEVLDAPIHSPT